MKEGFTLIELLVVVLIIGILASVALPQYQKAVERSRAAQAITLLKSVGQAYEAHHLSTGTWANSFDELTVDIPWTGNTKFLPADKDTRSNGTWALGIENARGFVILRVGRIDGKYKGASFHLNYEHPTYAETRLLCSERLSNGNFLFDTSLEHGAYCSKIMKGAPAYNNSWVYAYTLP